MDYLDPGYNGTSYGGNSLFLFPRVCMHFSRIKFIFVAMFARRRHVGMEKKKKKKKREMIKVPLKRGTVTVGIIVLKIDVEK